MARRLIVALLAVTLGAFGAACAPPDVELVAIADQFEAPGDWELVNESLDPRPGCLAGGCDRAIKTWRTASLPGRADVVAAMEAAGWTGVSVDDDCQPWENTTGPFPFCRGAAASGNAQIDLTVSGPMAGDQPWRVTILVKRETTS